MNYQFVQNQNVVLNTQKSKQNVYDVENIYFLDSDL